VNLAWHGWLTITNRRDQQKNREWHNIVLQVVLSILSVNCIYQGYLLNQPLMMLFSLIGFATVATNVHYMMKTVSRPAQWINEHLRVLIGAGISVYTAFSAFGAVRLMPHLALNPILWAIPLTTGVSLIIYHQYQTTRRFAPRARNAAAASGQPQPHQMA
jgi:ABC-type Na+ efflux pump permease subunit